MEYAAPRRIETTDDCYFYHTMELPAVGEVQGHWDLRTEIDAYLGNVDFRGKRVLDVGTASGYPSFEMEKRGGAVVSFDMASGAQWDLVPQRALRDQRDALLAQRADAHRMLQNGYWFSHERLDSKAQAFYGNVYELPEQLGPFDVVFFGMILGHLRDPFQALYSASLLCRDTLIVTNSTSKKDRGKEPTARFQPSAANGITDAWWDLSIGCIENMLGVLGFRVIRRPVSHPRCLVPGHAGKIHCTALVAERIEPA